MKLEEAADCIDDGKTEDIRRGFPLSKLSSGLELAVYVARKPREYHAFHLRNMETQNCIKS